MLNWSVIINCALWCKEGGLGKTRLLPHAKMLLVPINCFRWRVDYALEKNVLTEQMWISYWEVLTCVLIFYLFWNVKHFILWLIKGVRLCTFSKVPLDLKNSKPFSFCPWISLFPGMFCHAGHSQLAFLAGWLILTDSDSQIQISSGL